MTGATGYIGGAVASELRHHGHEVTALVRPESEARHLRDLGVVMLAGDLDALPSLGDAFAEALLVDQIVSSNITRERLGWTPKRTFINSIDEQWREWRESQSTAR